MMHSIVISHESRSVAADKYCRHFTWRVCKNTSYVKINRNHLSLFYIKGVFSLLIQLLQLLAALGAFHRYLYIIFITFMKYILYSLKKDFIKNVMKEECVCFVLYFIELATLFYFILDPPLSHCFFRLCNGCFLSIMF